MKRLITAALALSLLGGVSAYAQDGHRDHGDRGAGGGRGGGAQQAAPQQGRGGGPERGGGGQGRGQPQQQQFRQAQPQAQAPPQQFRGGQERGFQGNRGGPAPQFNGGQRFEGNRGGPAPQFNGGQRFEGNRGGVAPQFNGGRGFAGPGPGFRQGRVWQAPQRFRGPEYFFPRGFGYRAWSFGEYLPGPFFVSDYTLYNYWAYGLPAPPPGYEWIRVGPDALLVQIGSGYILDVARGLFW